MQFSGTTVLGDVSRVSVGMTPPRGEPGRGAVEVPWITIRDVTDGKLPALPALGRIRLPDTPAIDKGTTKYGDVLIAARGSAPRIAWVDDDAEGAVASANLLIIRPTADLLGPALFAMLSSRPYQSLILGLSRGTTGQTSITAADLRRLPIDVPPMRAQKRAAKLIENSDAAFRHAIEAAQERKRIGLAAAATLLLG